MGVDRVHDVLDVSTSCTMYSMSVDYVHDVLDVFSMFSRCFTMYSMFTRCKGTSLGESSAKGCMTRLSMLDRIDSG